LNAVARSVSVRPENVVLPSDTCVTIRQVQARPELNGVRGTIESYDRAAGRYVVKLSKSEAVRLKPGNVIA
jgi:hypothetical protein